MSPAEQINRALDQSSSTGKPVLAQIGGNWCRDARRLDAFYESHPEVANIIKKHFVHIRVNYDREGANEAVTTTLPSFSWVPTLFVVDSSGNVVAKAEGPEFDSPDGYDEDQLIAFLRSHQN